MTLKYLGRAEGVAAKNSRNREHENQTELENSRTENSRTRESRVNGRRCFRRARRPAIGAPERHHTGH